MQIHILLHKKKDKRHNNNNNTQVHVNNLAANCKTLPAQTHCGERGIFSMHTISIKNCKDHVPNYHGKRVTNET